VARATAAARRARDRARHEQDVLVAAERVFSRRGFHGAVMTEIARESQFSVGTLYNLFGSKEAIIERLLLACLEEFEAAIEHGFRSAKSARERLEEIAVQKARVAARRRDFLALFASSTPGLLETQGFEFESVLAAHERMRARMRTVIADGMRKGELRDDLPVDVVALMLDAVTRAHSLERVVKRRGELDEAEVRAVARALLDGLAR
jgi:AcrR family transcriptional regulator